MTSEPIDHRREKHIVLAGLTIYWFLTGIFSVLTAPEGPAFGITFFVTAIGWGIGILLWCKTDAEERGGRLSGGETFFIVAFGGLGLLFYLFNTRGGLGGFKAIGWLLLYLFFGFILVTVMLTIALTALKLAGVNGAFLDPGVKKRIFPANSGDRLGAV